MSNPHEGWLQMQQDKQQPRPDPVPAMLCTAIGLWLVIALVVRYAL